MNIKLTTSRVLLIGCAIGAALAFSGGCQTSLGKQVGGLFYSPATTNQPPAVTNSVPVYAPADIVTHGKTNQQTGVITAPVAKDGAVATSTNTVVVEPPPTVHYENGAAWGTLQTAAGTIPGWGWLASWGLTLIAAGGKAYMNRKEGNTLKTIAVTTFQGVENFINAAVASGDPKAAALANQLKSILAAAHDYADVAPQVQNLIDQYTGASNVSASVAQTIKATTPVATAAPGTTIIPQ